MNTMPPQPEDKPPLIYADTELTQFDAPWHLWPRFATIHVVVSGTALLLAFASASGASASSRLIPQILGICAVVLLFPSWLIFMTIISWTGYDVGALLCCSVPILLIINSIAWGLAINCIYVLYRYWQHKRALQSNKK